MPTPPHRQRRHSPRRRLLLVPVLLVVVALGALLGLAVIARAGRSASLTPAPAAASAAAAAEVPTQPRTPPAPTTTLPGVQTATSPAVAPLTTTPQPTAGAAPAPPTERLTGKVILIDPGHNGGNAANATEIGKTIWNGRANETCDTTGTQTNAGYTESQFNFAVAQDLAAVLRQQGATVVLTRETNTGVGPCVTERAAAGNNVHADAAISIHADGGPAAGRGFAVLEPVADGPNDAIIGSSAVLGRRIRDTLVADGVEPTSSYDGVDGIAPRNDLAGTNLSTVPKVFLECANMRNTTDAALIIDPAWQHAVATSVSKAIATFVLAPS